MPDGIDKGYSDCLAAMVAVWWDTVSMADDKNAGMRDGEDHFREGLPWLQKIRDKAKEIAK